MLILHPLSRPLSFDGDRCDTKQGMFYVIRLLLFLFVCLRLFIGKRN